MSKWQMSIAGCSTEELWTRTSTGSKPYLMVVPLLYGRKVKGKPASTAYIKHAISHSNLSMRISTGRLTTYLVGHWAFAGE